jgi:sterol desaturase/sphingolipid hydroxylase (fatty acid hydroxylase superfamily)
MDRIALFKTAPFLDHYGGLIFGALFALLFFAQRKFPLRRQRFPALRRLVRNLIFFAPGLALARISLVPIPILVALWAARHHFGLLHLIPVPRWLAIALGVFVMDYAYWWWHVGLHLIPVLWRFHNVHHCDLDLDVSTATRFHLGEVIFSVPFRMVVVALFGIDFWALVVFEIMFEAANMFEHSNWRLPIKVERILNHLLVTPRMHGIHHSIVQRETNSNWGTVFCLWDSLHRTLRRDIPQDAITIGVAAYRDEAELTVGKLFVLPFQSPRSWKLPNGEVPEREPKPAEELAP